MSHSPDILVLPEGIHATPKYAAWNSLVRLFLLYVVKLTTTRKT